MATKTADDVIWNMLKRKQDVLNRAGLFCEDLQDASHTLAPTGVSAHNLSVPIFIKLFIILFRLTVAKNRKLFLACKEGNPATDHEC